jgi:hypothetical protein
VDPEWIRISGSLYPNLGRLDVPLKKKKKDIFMVRRATVSILSEVVDASLGASNSHFVLEVQNFDSGFS